MQAYNKERPHNTVNAPANDYRKFSPHNKAFRKQALERITLT